MKKMPIIIIACLVAALGFAVTLGAFSRNTKNEIEYQAVTGTGARVNHLVSVDPDTYDVLTKYAFSHNITVSQTLAKMVSPSTTTVTWNKDEINAGTVSVNLIRMVSPSPVAYDHLRTVVAGTENTGTYTFPVLPTDLTPETYIEIGCVGTIQGGCTALPLIPLN